MAELKWLVNSGNYYYFKDAPVHATGVSLDKDSITLTEAGQTEQLTATVSPADAINKKVIWNSSDTSVATVSNTGLVTCVTPGDATITATCADGGASASCSITQITPITTPGIYYNATLGLISLSGDGSNWITIADKNLGATSTDTSSTDSYGNYYQWGNNYAFPNSGNVTTNSNQVNTSNYGPGNYYNSSTFIIRSTRSDWSSPSNDNLWGGTTGTVDAMRGPCSEGYHIPSHDEWSSVWGILKNSLGLPNSYTTLPTYLKMPLSGHRGYDDAIVYMYGTNGFYWSSTPYSGNVVSYCFIFGQNYSTVSTDNAHYRGMGFSIRPFKNVAVQPDDSWTVLYQPS